MQRTHHSATSGAQLVFEDHEWNRGRTRGIKAAVRSYGASELKLYHKEKGALLEGVGGGCVVVMVMLSTGNLTSDEEDD